MKDSGVSKTKTFPPSGKTKSKPTTGNIGQVVSRTLKSNHMGSGRERPGHLREELSEDWPLSRFLNEEEENGINILGIIQQVQMSRIGKMFQKQRGI